MRDLGGTIRATSPEATLAKLEPLLLPVFGITRVANITGLDHINIPTYVAIRPNSKTLSTSQGKGISKPLAKISAIMESIESWHGENVRAPDLTGSYHALKDQYPLIKPDPFLIGVVGYPDVDDRSMSWIVAHDIIQDKPVYIPYNLICLDTTNLPKGHAVFAPTSNGLAAGNTVDEAICHGLYEVIERDCIYDFKQLSDEQREERRVNLSSIDCSHNRELLTRIEKAGIQVYVWDISNRFGIPAFAVEMGDSGQLRGVGLFGGYGAHLSQSVALSRALTEAVQSRLTYISGSRDDFMPSAYQNNVTHHTNYSLKTCRDFSSTPKIELPHDFKGCISLVKEKLERLGIQQIIVFNHTRKDVGIPVAHVLVPNLKMDWRSHRMVR